MAKPTPMLPLWALVSEPGSAGDRRVDPDDLALHVEQRPARVAGVDRGVGLDGVDVGLVVGVTGGDRAVQRADDARGHGGVEAERGTDGDHLVADDDVGRAAQGERGEVGAVDLDHGQVVGPVAPDDLAVDLLAVGEHDGDRAAVGGTGHDVVVGDDVPCLVVDPAGARAGAVGALDPQGHHAGRGAGRDVGDGAVRAGGGAGADARSRGAAGVGGRCHGRPEPRRAGRRGGPRRGRRPRRRR